MSGSQRRPRPSGNPTTVALDEAWIERMVRLEQITDNILSQMKTLVENTQRLTNEQRALSESQTRSLRDMQEISDKSRREDQESSRKAISDLQNSAQSWRAQDQRDFQEALAKVVAKVEAITISGNDMASKYLKRDDLLWIRQAAGTIMVLLLGGLWTWWLGRFK